MSSLADRVRQALERKAVTQAALARATGIKQPSVNDWLSGKTKTLRAATLLRAAAFLGCDPHWLNTGQGRPNWTDDQHWNEGTRGGVAQVLSQLKPEDPPQVTWGAKMKKSDLPPLYRVTVPDDAMAPRVRAGQLVEFDRDATPRPGDGVLVLDGEGRPYFRVFRERRPGHWEAHPLNDAYSPLDSLADQLTVAGVLVAVFARWG